MLRRHLLQRRLNGPLHWPHPAQNPQRRRIIRHDIGREDEVQGREVFAVERERVVGEGVADLEVGDGVLGEERGGVGGCGGEEGDGGWKGEGG